MQDAMHKFQDWVLEEAKEELLKMGNSLSRAFILAPMMEVPERIKRCCELRSGGPNEAGAHFRDNVMLMVPISYNDERLLYSYIRHLGQEDSEARLDALVASGTSLEAIISACKWAHNVTEMDICAEFLRKFCHDVHAVAICKLDEVWMEASPSNSGDDSLAAEAKLE